MGSTERNVSVPASGKPDVSTIAQTTDTQQTHDPLHAEVQQYARVSSTGTTDSTQTVPKFERITFPTIDDSQVTKIDPYGLSREAIASATELKQLLSMNLADNATINDNGKDKTVAQFRQELQTQIRSDMSEAIGRADALKQTGGTDSVEGMLTKFMQDPSKEGQRQKLAQELGIDIRNTTPAEIQQLESSPNLSADQRDKAKQLMSLEVEYQELNQLRYAPSVVRLQYADILASGMLNPNGADAAAGKVPLSDATDAFHLVHSAGNADKTGEIRNTADYQNLNQITTNEFSTSQTERVQNMLGVLQQAQTAEKDGDKTKAETLYKSASDQANGVDVAFLIQNINNQRDPQIAQQMLAQVVSAETAREDYARFLIQQGRSAEALPLLTKVQGDVPQLVQNDQNFNNLMNQALDANKNGTSDDPSVHFNNIQQAIQKKDYNKAFDEVTKAKQSLANIDFDKVQKDVTSLQAQQTALQKKQADLEKDNTLSPDDKKNQETLVKQDMAVNQAYLQAEQQKLDAKDQVTYLEGYVDYLRQDNKGAYTAFQQFQKDNPDLAKQPDYHLDELLKATKPPGFWDKWKGVLIGGAAVLAGLGAAALTIWSGPGAAIAGLGAGAAVTAALTGTAALGAAAIAGAGVYTGLHAASGDKVSWQTAFDGAKLGLTGGSLVVAPYMASELAVGGSATSLAAAVRGASAASWAPRAIAFGSVMGANQVADQGYDMAYNGKSFGDALKDGAIWTAGAAAVGGSPLGRMMMSGGVRGSIGVPTAAIVGAPMAVQGYSEIRQDLHGPLNPNNNSDYDQIANLNQYLPGQYTVDNPAPPAPANDSTTTTDTSKTSPTNTQQTGG